MTAFNVAGLLHEPPGATREIRLRDHYVTLGPDVELAGPIDADLRLQRTNRGILVRGELAATLRRTCSRCIDAFVEEVRIPISEEFLPTVDPLTGAPVLADPDDGETPRIDEHHEIELDTVFHDELSLTEPVFALCRPDCRGLCPTCGERLDRGEHAHGDAEIDPRLAGLAALLHDARDES
jgi:uncharacterized protein